MGSDGAAADRVLARLEVAGAPVARVLDGGGSPGNSVPRPFLHPVRTRAGTTLTDRGPDDHPWHAGLGVAMPDVDGVNCWGGPTWSLPGGYAWRDDHGRADVMRTAAGASSLDQAVVWSGPDGRRLLLEERSLRWAAAGAGWRLDWMSVWRTPGTAPVALGSPGSNGRVGAGYGGFTWRSAPCRDVVVRTADGSGERVVHGSVAPWVEWSAEYDSGPATVRIEAVGHGDPWFVRVDEYPAVGSALAWDRPVVVAPATPLVRGFRVTVTDGWPERAPGADAHVA